MGAPSAPLWQAFIERPPSAAVHLVKTYHLDTLQRLKNGLDLFLKVQDASNVAHVRRWRFLLRATSLPSCCFAAAPCHTDTMASSLAVT